MRRHGAGGGKFSATILSSSLEEQLVAGNPSLAEADARFRQAKAVVRQDRAAYAPTIGTSLSADRLHGSSGALNGIEAGTGQYSLTGDVSWEPDFWGRVRQTVAAGVASAQAVRGDLENARLSLTATLALDYFQPDRSMRTWCCSMRASMRTSAR